MILYNVHAASFFESVMATPTVVTRRDLDDSGRPYVKLHSAVLKY